MRRRRMTPSYAMPPTVGCGAGAFYVLAYGPSPLPGESGDLRLVALR
jgi:hypothetical protein